MRTLQITLGTGVVVALLGLNTVFADIRTMSSVPPMTFSLDIGDGTVMPDVSFDTMGGVGGDEAQMTCMMTPGGPNIDVVLDLPPITPVADAGYNPLTPLNSLAPSPPPSGSYPSGGGYPGRDRSRPFMPDPELPDPENPDPPPLVVPAPATLVVVGLGIAGVAIMRRKRRT